MHQHQISNDEGQGNSHENGSYFFKQREKIFHERDSFVKALEKVIHNNRVTHECKYFLVILEILKVKSNLHEESDQLSVR